MKETSKLIESQPMQYDVDPNALEKFGVKIGDTIKAPHGGIAEIIGVYDGKLWIQFTKMKKPKPVALPFSSKEEMCDAGYIVITESTKTTEIKKEQIIKSVIFEKKEKPDGSYLFVSSAPNRKRIELSNTSKSEPHAGIQYDVHVIKDTEPNNPNAGKFIVELIPEQTSSVPFKTKDAKIKKNEKPLPIEVDQKEGIVYVLETILPYNFNGGIHVPHKEKFSHYALDTRTIQTIEKVAQGVELRQPTLLEGETAVSKTSAIEYLAMITNNEVRRFNFNGQTDTSELIGKYVPNDGQLQISFEQTLANPEYLKENSIAILTKARSEGRSLTLFESQKIAEIEGIKIAEWRWQNGIVVDAIEKDQWIIFDEINLADPQIRERLNSLLENPPSLTLSENGGTLYKILTQEETELYNAGKLKGVKPIGQNFRMFATMNPAEYSGRMAMSPAEKDRWPNYKYVPNPTEPDFAIMMKLLVFGEQPEIKIHGQLYSGRKVEPLFPKLNKIKNIRELLQKIAKFHSNIETMARKRDIGRGKKEPYIFTRRTILAFLSFLEEKKFVDRREGKFISISEQPEIMVLRALKEYYIDKMRDSDDLKKMDDLLSALGISENNWTFKFI